MQLSRLIDNLTDAEHGGLPEINITALTADSRQVIPDALFVAVRGENYDGHDYIVDAVKQGQGLSWVKSILNKSNFASSV